MNDLGHFVHVDENISRSSDRIIISRISSDGQFNSPKYHKFYRKSYADIV